MKFEFLFKIFKNSIVNRKDKILFLKMLIYFYMPAHSKLFHVQMQKTNLFY